MSCDNKNYFPDIVKGDTFNGNKMTFYNGKGNDKTPMDLTGASIIIPFKKGVGQNVVFKFDTADNTILIPEPTDGTIILAPRKMDYPAYNYIFDVQVTFANGVQKTFFTNNWRVCQDV